MEGNEYRISNKCTRKNIYVLLNLKISYIYKPVMISLKNSLETKIYLLYKYKNI